MPSVALLPPLSHPPAPAPCFATAAVLSELYGGGEKSGELLMLPILKTGSFLSWKSVEFIGPVNPFRSRCLSHL